MRFWCCGVRAVHICLQLFDTDLIYQKDISSDGDNMSEEKNRIAHDSDSNSEATQLSSMIIMPLDIKNLIYVIRNQQVMLDSDLAALYLVETKVLNQAVKRNISRFPEKFCFQLTSDEFENLKSQFVTSSLEGNEVSKHGGRRTMPYVFTEQGIAMLSAVLRSETAIQVSIRIMETFVEMRRFIANNSILFQQITNVELKLLEYAKKTDTRLDEIFEYISGNKEDNQKVFFDGQIYDAFSIISKIIQKAKYKHYTHRWVCQWRHT
jgi:hypothetical protein